MKRYLAALLTVMLLAGCAGNTQPDAEQTQDPTSNVNAGALYVPQSAVEQQTAGAVTMYRLPVRNAAGLAAVGERLLLKLEENMLQVISAAQGTASEPAAPEGFDWNGAWMSTNSGFIYYDSGKHQAVMVDMQLQEWKRIDLPEMDDSPVFTYDNSRIYFCKGHEVRSLELDLGIDRLIRTHTCKQQKLTGSLLGGKVLICQLTDENDTTRTLYISSENGQSLNENQNVLSITAGDTYYWASTQEGTLKQQLVGTADGRPMTLMTAQDQTLRSALEMDGILGCRTGEDRCLYLNFYGMEEGKVTASVRLRGIGAPEHYLADKRTGSIWFLSMDPATNEQVLLRWQVEKSGVDNAGSCVSTWYDPENPDAEGLKALKTRADKLGKTYGVNVCIWKDALKSNDRYVLEPEHQTTVIAAALDELEKVLAVYPQKFVGKSTGSKLRICIVRSVSQQVTGVQLWSGSEPYIFLSAGSDMSSEFAKALGYVVTSRALGNTSIMDDWQSLNPEGFQYGTSPDQALLEGTTRAFADEESASIITEDRCRIFWQAMLKDNQKMFESEIMQKKLTKLSLAIRDAYGMKKRTEIFPWEQYLHTPVAYVKK